MKIRKREWPADKVEHRKLAALVPAARNARTHSKEQVAQLARSIETWGWTIPVLVDEQDVLIAGHGRILAAASLGIELVPCMVARGWSEEKRRAYMLADNQLALNAAWDTSLLAEELSALGVGGFDLGLIGFTPDQIGELLTGDVNSGDEEAVPAVEGVVVSRPGDVWCCAGHRIMCGDSTDPGSVAILCAGELVDAVWMDPPYNVDYSGKAGKIQNDALGPEAFRALLDGAMRCAFLSLKNWGPIYVAHADTEGLAFRGAFVGAGFHLASCLVWVKPSLVLGRSDYQWRHEPILYGWKPGGRHVWFGGRARTSVFEDPELPLELDAEGGILVRSGGAVFRITGADLQVEGLAETVVRAEKPARSDEHPTMKPVGLVADQLRVSSKRGDRVLDLFGGSGSTGIAAHKLGRVSRLMELDPKFVDVIVRRMQAYCAAPAILEETGEAFDLVQSARHGAKAKAAARKDRAGGKAA